MRDMERERENISGSTTDIERIPSVKFQTRMKKICLFSGAELNYD